MVTGALLAAALGAHLYITIGDDPLSYTGPLLFLDHLFDLGLAAALAMVCLALGKHILARLRLSFATPPEELAFSLAAGAAALALAILVLGVVRLLKPPTLMLTMLLIMVLVRGELAAAPRRVAESLLYLKEHGGHRALWVSALAITCAVAVGLLLNALAPPTDWDALMYHLEVPRQFVESGRLLVPEDNLHVAFTGLVHMLYVPLLALNSSAAPAILSAIFTLVLGLAVFSLAERLFGGATASLALATLWGTTSLLLVAITPRIDVTLALYVFLSLYALVLVAERDAGGGHLKLAAFLLGSAIGVKLHALAFAAALSPVVIWAIWRQRRSWRTLPVPILLFASLTVAAAAPWIIKNWILLGVPLYPIGTVDLLQPWLAALYGSATAPESINPGIYTVLGQARLPFNLFDLFFTPGRLTVEFEGAHYHMNLLFLLLPLWPLFYRRRSLNALVLVAVAYVVVVVLPFRTTNLRYLIPAYPPLTVAAAFIAVQVSQRLLSKEAQRLLLVALALIAVYPSAKTIFYWLRKSDVAGYVAGVTSRREYLDGGYNFYSRMTEATNELVPSDGKVLLLFEARGFYFRPKVIQDNVLTNWPLVAPLVSRDSTCLKATGVTHVLVSNAAVSYYVNRGTDPELFQGSLFPPFAERCLELVHQGRGFTLYRTRP